MRSTYKSILAILRVKISAMLQKYHPLIVPKKQFNNKCSSSLITRLCCTGRRWFTSGKRVKITGKYADISKN